MSWWRWMELGGGRWSWEKLGGGRWSWLEVGARFSNTHFLNVIKISLSHFALYLQEVVYNRQYMPECIFEETVN